MTDSHFIPLANHILHSIQKDLLILKEHQVLDDKTYQDIITLLPAQAKPLFNEMNTINTINNNNNNNNNTIRPPLPTRKSTSTSPRITPTPAPRTPSFPKLPSRRSESQAFEPIIENIPTIKKIETNTTTTTTPPPPPSYNASVKTQMVEAVYDYNGDPSTDLSFHKGDIFEVTEHVNDDWWRGTLNGKSGIFPQNHVQV
ncbi:SH3 domain-containing protein [Cunninghamella echinulata]|nr:SH3 domain-containing protein [Cunninghamella echinulata]